MFHELNREYDCPLDSIFINSQDIFKHKSTLKITDLYCNLLIPSWIKHSNGEEDYNEIWYCYQAENIIIEPNYKFDYDGFTVSMTLTTLFTDFDMQFEWEYNVKEELHTHYPIYNPFNDLIAKCKLETDYSSFDVEIQYHFNSIGEIKSEKN